MQGGDDRIHSGEPGRRRFLARVICGIHTAIGGTLAVILGGSIAAPSFARRRETWLRAALVSDLAEGEPTPVTLSLARADAYARVVDRQTVFLVKRGQEVTALSSVCTHLGCRVRWDREALELTCPCHGGVFDRSGNVTAGPPAAPLATLPTKIDGNHVLVSL